VNKICYLIHIKYSFIRCRMINLWCFVMYVRFWRPEVKQNTIWSPATTGDHAFYRSLLYLADVRRAYAVKVNEWIRRATTCWETSYIVLIVIWENSLALIALSVTSMSLLRCAFQVTVDRWCINHNLLTKAVLSTCSTHAGSTFDNRLTSTFDLLNLESMHFERLPRTVFLYQVWCW